MDSVAHVGKIKDVSRNEVVVSIDAAKLEQTTGKEAREMALTAATKCGMTQPGINAQSGAYPIRADGTSTDKVEEWASIVASEGYKYRNDFTVKSAKVN